MNHVVILVLINLILFFIYIEIKKYFIRKKLRHFCRPTPEYPIVGIAGRFIGKPNDQIVEIVLNLFDEVKSTPFQMWIGPILSVGVSDPKDVQTLLTNENCLNRPYVYNFIPCNESMVAKKKELWRPDRRALNTSFNINVLQSFVPHLNEKCRILIEKMEPHVKRASDFHHLFDMCSMDMITRTMLGIEMNVQSERGSRICHCVAQILSNIQYRLPRIWLHCDFTYSLTQVSRDEQVALRDFAKFINEIYERKVNELEALMSNGVDRLKEANESNSMNFLEKCLLLEQNGIFTQENVLDNVRLMIFAGGDTTTMAVFGTALLLAMNQKHQEIVVNELRGILGTADAEVTYKHLNEMKYTERAIKEAMRLLPPGPFIARETSADIELSKGVIPKNTIVFFNIIHMHRSSKVWGENALEFDPDRFLPENVANRPSLSYIPFSGGPRNCIGLKFGMIMSKMMLAHLLRKYKFTTALRFDEIILNTHLISRVENEDPIRIENRLDF